MNRRTAAYRRRLEADGAHWSTHREREVVERFGERSAEATALETWEALGTGELFVADRSERDTLVIEREDAVRWLQGLVTNDLHDLQHPGSGQRTHAVSRIGRAIADARILHIPDALLVDLEPGALTDGEPSLIKHLRGHLITERVRLTDRSDAAAQLAIFGQDAARKLSALGGFAHVLRHLDGHDGSWGQLGDLDVVVQRLPWIGAPGFSIWCAREDAETLWRMLRAHAHPLGHAALELLRQDAGIPRFGVEYDARTIPLEADLNHTINYEKGCYLGQEVIHRLDTRGTPAKMLRVVEPTDTSAAAELRIGTKILHDGRTVGAIAHTWHSPSLGRPLAMAYLKRGAYDPDTAIFLAAADDAPPLPAHARTLGYPLRTASGAGVGGEPGVLPSSQ